MSELEHNAGATDRPEKADGAPDPPNEGGVSKDAPAEAPDVQVDTGGGDANIDTGKKE